MKTLIIIFSFFGLISVKSYSQRFYLGDQLSPNSTEFKFLGISSSTGVSTYHYLGAITEKNYFGRKIDDIIVGIKNGIIVTTIYNFIPEPGDVGVPKSIIDLIQSNLPYPLANVNGVYSLNIDNESISISRVTNSLTFGKDRIMFLNSIKQSILENT